MEWIHFLRKIYWSDVCAYHSYTEKFTIAFIVWTFLIYLWGGSQDFLVKMARVFLIKGLSIMEIIRFNKNHGQKKITVILNSKIKLNP